MGMFDGVKKAWTEATEEVKQEEAADVALKAMLMSTGDIPNKYTVLDIVFAMDSHQEGYFSGAASPSTAFEGVKKQLRSTCKSLGGDAVIYCQFEYRVSVGKSAFGNAAQCIEIYAYGTAVKYTPATPISPPPLPTPAPSTAFTPKANS